MPLLPEVAQLLKKWRKEQLELKISLGNKWQPMKGLENLVFTIGEGRPMNEGKVKAAIKRILKEIRVHEEQQAEKEDRKPRDIKDFTPHALRHTFATRALENGIPPKVVQEILGHGSITITLDLYTHVLPETKQEEIQKIAHLI